MEYDATSPVGGFTDIDPHQINAFIKNTCPDVSPPGSIYVTFAKAHDVAAELLVGSAIEETGWFTSYAWRKLNNPAGIGPGRAFPTTREGVLEHCRLVRQQYLTPGTMQWERQKYWGAPGTLFPVMMVWVTGGSPSVDPSHKAHAEDYVRKVVSRANAIQRARKPLPGTAEARGEQMVYAVGYVMREGIMQGYPAPDGLRFRPYWPLTRAELACVIANDKVFGKRLAGVVPAPRPPDVPAGFWAEGDIRTVMGAGWMSGYPDGTFRPNNAVSRAETVSVLHRVGAPQVQAVAGRGFRTFADVGATDWFAEPVMWAFARGWLEEFTEAGRFVPGAPITRAELSFLLRNMLEQPGRLTSAASVDSWALLGYFGTRLGAAVAGVAQQTGTGQFWVPRWAVPAIYSGRETADLPFTLVDPEAVAPASSVLSGKPLVPLAAGGALVAAGAYLWWRG